MSFIFRLLTAVELFLWLKKLREASNGDVAQDKRGSDSGVHDHDRPTGSSVLDDTQSEAERHPHNHQDAS